MGSRILYNSFTVTMTKNSVIQVKIILNGLKNRQKGLGCPNVEFYISFY